MPRKTLPVGTQLFRIHRQDRSPWFFSNAGLGRFDPTGSPTRGSAYWAEDPLGAWIEVFRTRLLLPASEILARRLSTIRVTKPLVVADLASRRALRAGVTAATTAGHDYAEAHALADALQGVRSGVRWRLRHDLHQTLIGVAVFGELHQGAPASLSKPSISAIAAELVAEAERQFGYEVLPDPPSRRTKPS